MNYGIGAPKFYIYNSAGDTLQKTITLSSNILADKPIIDELKIRNTSPYTRTKLQEALGYYFRQTLTAGIGDYNSTLLQYQADQANSSKRNDIFKLQQVLTYCNSGNVIKYTPHADLEDLWGFSPLTVFVTLEDLGYTGTNKTDSITVTVEGTSLTSSAFLWYEFSFTELNGVTNANQCLSFNGSSNYLSCTEFSCSTLHSIEFWTKGTTFGAGNYVMSGTTGTENSVVLGTTAIFYTAQTVSKSVTHGATAASLNHWFITRNGTAVVFYLNGAQIGAAQTLASNPTFHINKIGSISGNFYTGKLGLIRVYNITATAAQVKQQHNAGNGQHPLNVALYAVWECNGTGGTSTTEDNQETTASRDMAFTNAPTRTTW